MKRVCAVMISFHPDLEALQKLGGARAQVDALVVVDNGSAEVELMRLREAAQESDCVLLENGENLGIAAALNRGVRWALEQKADFVLLLDQDAHLEDGFVAAMSACLTASAEDVAIMAPRMVDARFGNALVSPKAGEHELEVAITSGSLTPTWVFEKAGLFAEELFIDQVDSEYSLRVRAMGLRIVECPNAVLRHSPATPSLHRLFWSKPFQVTNYSPTRRYYQGRNLVWMWRRYAKQFPAFMQAQVKIFAKDLLKTAWEKERFAKFWAVASGAMDGLRGRMGARFPRI